MLLRSVLQPILSSIASVWNTLNISESKNEISIPNLQPEGGENVDKDQETGPIEPATIPPMYSEAVEEDHKHDWDLFSKTYGKALEDIDVGQAGLPQALVEKMLFGVTTLLWKCVLCSETKKEEVLGTDESQLDDLFVKATNFGPQYIQKDGLTFVISKWQPATGQNIPLR